MVMVDNIWEDLVNNPSSLLSRQEQLNPQTVFFNLARAPPRLWIEAREKHLSDSVRSFESSAATWHAIVSDRFRTSLDDLSQKMFPVSHTKDAESPKLEDITADVRESWERKALSEWKQLERDFCSKLKKQTFEATISTTKLTNLVDYLDVPCEASRGPTKKHIEEAEKDVLELMNAIAEEEKAREAMSNRRSVANMQLVTLAAPFAALSSLAMSHICPFDVDVSHQGQEAIIHHFLLPSLETRVQLNGSMTKSICQSCEGYDDHDTLSMFTNRCCSLLLLPATLGKFMRVFCG